MKMNVDLFLKTINDMIKEQQMKLGYVRETVRLYIPGESLAHILFGDGYDYNCDFSNQVNEQVGLNGINITKIDTRYIINVYPEYNEFVHNNIPDNLFLADLIELFRHHNISIEDVKNVFSRYTNNYIYEESKTDEFDYLLYFNDKHIDDYYYLVKFDEGHASYHRFNEYDVKQIHLPVPVIEAKKS